MPQPSGWVSVVLVVLPALIAAVTPSILAHAWPSPPVVDSRPQPMTVVVVVVVVEDATVRDQQRKHRTTAPRPKTRRHR